MFKGGQCGKDEFLRNGIERIGKGRIDMKTIALFGAGGKMGLRLSANLKGSRYEVRHVEIGETGRAALRSRGIEPVDRG